MKQVGLLHYLPQVAAMHKESIWTDTNRWWNQDDVQAVVKQYLARFGRESDHPLREIRKTLKTISQS